MTGYEFGLYLGIVGLATMALGGLTSRGHSHDNDASNVSLPAHGHHGGASSPAGSSAGAPSPSLPALAARGGRAGAAARGLSPGKRLLSWLSPRVAFSVLVGFGATGSLLRGHVPPALVLVLAVLGGLLFEALLVAPLWRFILGFGSAPARTLDQSVLDEARAVSDFDKNGQGLISIELDGQIIQVLGTLRAEDRRAEVRVRTGDRLVVEDVDAQRNRCTVSRLGS